MRRRRPSPRRCRPGRTALAESEIVAARGATGRAGQPPRSSCDDSISATAAVNLRLARRDARWLELPLQLGARQPQRLALRAPVPDPSCGFGLARRLALSSSSSIRSWRRRSASINPSAASPMCLRSSSCTRALGSADGRTNIRSIDTADGVRRPRSLPATGGGLVPVGLRRPDAPAASGLAGHRARRVDADPRADRHGQDPRRVSRLPRPADVRAGRPTATRGAASSTSRRSRRSRWTSSATCARRSPASPTWPTAQGRAVPRAGDVDPHRRHAGVRAGAVPARSRPTSSSPRPSRCS